MPTVQQYADKILRETLDGIDGQIEEINGKLAKYDSLIEARTKLQSARRAILAQRSVTANGGGKGLSQEEVVKVLRDLGSATVHDVASKLGANESAVRAHLNRGKDERFNLTLDEGRKVWSLREPEEEDEEDEE